MNYLRPLINNELTLGFVIGVLGIEDIEEQNKAVNLITNAEVQLAQIAQVTKFNADFQQYMSSCSDEERNVLRNTILIELIKNRRIDNDDEIKLGVGGALPQTTVKKEKKAIFIIGLPASGKSKIASKMSDEYGAVILDSDFAKRKFPEYTKDIGASLVHEESTILIFGDKDKKFNYSLKEYCIAQSLNVIIPKIGNDEKSIINLVRYFKKYEYSIHLILISIDRVESTKRAFKRFKKTKRYVPLSLIFDMYSNDSVLTYYRIKNKKIFESYGKISTLSRIPVIIESSKYSPLNNMKL